jgi:sulfatase modifying factor 1
VFPPIKNNLACTVMKKLRLILFFVVALTCGLLLIVTHDFRSKSPIKLDEVSVAGGQYYVGGLLGKHDYLDHGNTAIKSFMVMSTEVDSGLYSTVTERAGRYGYTLVDVCAGVNQENCNLPDAGNDHQPVSGISWMAAAVFSNALSEINGLQPVYSVRGNALRGISIDSECVLVHEDPLANGYRLPTLAEWQVAARGGRPALEHGSYGFAHSGSSNAEEVAWLATNSQGHTWPVGTRQPNQLMLYDMSGNVSEWTSTSMDLGGPPDVGRLYYFCGENFESPVQTKLTSCDVHSALVSEPSIGFRLVRRTP